MKKNNIFIDYFVITIATILVGASIYYFMVPSNIPLGGVSGIALILANVLPFTVSQISLVLNAGLLVIGYFVIGPEFGTKTIYTSILIPVSMMVFEKISPDFQSIMGDPILDSIVSIVLFGFMCAVLFKRNASSGGLDIVGKIINKFLPIDLGKAVAYAGMVAAASSVFVYGVKTAILAVILTYFSGLVVDHFIFGFSEKKRVCIVSSHVKELTNYILKDLDAGATIYDATGAYNNQQVKEIITILDKNKYKALLNYIAKLDPTAFITVYPVNEIYTPEH